MKAIEKVFIYFSPIPIIIFYPIVDYETSILRGTARDVITGLVIIISWIIAFWGMVLSRRAKERDEGSWLLIISSVLAFSPNLYLTILSLIRSLG
ncbi:MAG: hypothetical protein ACQ9MH_14280 [Nitrospinales bacterium]